MTMTKTRPGGHRRTVQTALSGIALALAATATAGCDLFEESNQGSRAYSVEEKTSSLSVDTDGGDIEIVAGDPRSDAVRVKERYAYTEHKPETEHAVKDGRLSLTAADCGGSGGKCDVSYEVRVPPKTSVRLDTDGGTVTVRGTAGSVDAGTDGGDIRIEDSSARRVKAHTEGGSVSGTFAATPGTVDCSSEGGDVEVRLPGGPYAVDAGTKGGDRKVTVPTEKTSSPSVRAHTEGGDVTVSPAG